MEIKSKRHQHIPISMYNIGQREKYHDGAKTRQWKHWPLQYNDYPRDQTHNNGSWYQKILQGCPSHQRKEHTLPKVANLMTFCSSHREKVH